MVLPTYRWTKTRFARRHSIEVRYLGACMTAEQVVEPVSRSHQLASARDIVDGTRRIGQHNRFGAMVPTAVEARTMDTPDRPRSGVEARRASD